MSPDPIDTPPALSLLLREMSGLREDLRDHRVEIDGRLKGIEAQVASTNGRLRRAEAWVAAMKALATAVALLIPFAVALFTKHL